jgi:4'-phosphopantetheinyl transferase EntD
VVGSITHTDSWCAVAIASASVVAGLGIDVEAALPLPDGVGRLVLDDHERAALSASPPLLRSCADRAIFSAKEAAYKAIYPAVRRVLGFEAMRVSLDVTGTFTAELQEPAGPYPTGTVLRGTWVITRELIGTAVVLDR